MCLCATCFEELWATLLWVSERRIAAAITRHRRHATNARSRTIDRCSSSPPLIQPKSSRWCFLSGHVESSRRLLPAVNKRPARSKRLPTSSSMQFVLWATPGACSVHLPSPFASVCRSFFASRDTLRCVWLLAFVLHVLVGAINCFRHSLDSFAVFHP